MIGLITGSGSYSWPGIDSARAESFRTRYGAVELTTGRIGDVDVVHLPRHGSGHRFLSSQLDHRANLTALMDKGVDAVLSFTVCGALDLSLPLGAIVVFDDMYFPSNRLPDGSPCTWHDVPGSAGRGHWIFDRPFSEPLRAALAGASDSAGAPVFIEGCYGHVDGPRFNSRTEISALAAAGVTAVSQTGGPEVVLAGEAGLPLALVGFVTDYANGIAKEPTLLGEIAARIEQSTAAFSALAGAALPAIQAAALSRTGAFYRFGP